jgi:hypothetical protein
MIRRFTVLALSAALVLFVFPALQVSGALAAAPPDPPATPKLIFVHHSCGSNWLADGNGGLGTTLRDHNYFVSDTNYGWGPDSVGSYTDIGNWWEWFRGPSSNTYLTALFSESGQNTGYSRLGSDPGGENRIIMFKSCYPNSALQGSISDPVPDIASNPLKGQSSGSATHTVANAKGIYLDLLEYFKTRPDKMFVIVTAPPLRSGTYAGNARYFNDWLVNDLLDSYPLNNVFVFDFYNVLTSNGGGANTSDLGWADGNHHRWWLDAVQHKTDGGGNTLAYPTGDDHPSAAGNQKASAEFVDLLNHAWRQYSGTPNITSINPESGAVTTEVTINGTRFGDSRGASYVSFGAVPAVTYNEWNDTRIRCLVPAGAISRPVTVTTAEGTSNGKHFVVPLPGVASTFYFAEGYTGTGFEEWLCMLNRNAVDGIAQVTFLYADGSEPYVWDYELAASSRTTAYINDTVGAGKNVSMRVDSDVDIVAERPMYFDYQLRWTGGHDVIGTPAPANQFYFAEGYTGAGFEEWLCLANPHDYEVSAPVTYYFGEGLAPLDRDYDLPANSRTTLNVNAEVGEGKNVSIHVHAADPIVAERPMYFDYRGAWTGGHDVIGIGSPQATFYFAEGYTGAGFEEWLCLMNPGAATSADVTYIFQDGATPPRTVTHPLPADSRTTVNVNLEAGTDRNLSVVVEADDPIVAERPMYFNYRYAWTGGHDVIGATSLNTDFYFAEGYTGAGFEEWLCLMNPGDTESDTQVIYYYGDGTPAKTVAHTLPAHSRVTVYVNDEAGAGKNVSMWVWSEKGIVAERPIYFDYRGAWTGGHDVIGFTP